MSGFGATALAGLALSPAAPEPQTADDPHSRFWISDVRNPDEEPVTLARTRAIGAGTPERAAFFYYDAPSATFRFGAAIGDEGLRDTGDANLILRVDRIRASAADQARLQDYEGGSLRIDLQQTAKLPSLGEKLAWTAIAGFLPENKKLPALSEMTFNPGTTWGDLQSVPLPGGGGKWTWNFFLKRKKSRWMQVMEVLRRTKDVAGPILGLGLPAIALTALNTVDRIVAALAAEDRTEWLFQSRDMFLYATKSARDAFVGNKLRLRQGFYIIVPEGSAGAFDKQANQFALVEGLVVPKKTRPAQAIDASKEVLPGVTYLTIGSTVRRV